MEYTLSAKELWDMTPHDFNKWRAVNDLPVLFDYFRKTLPSFNIWLETLNITEEEMYLTLNLGEFFNGETEKVVIRHCTTHGVDQKFCIEKHALTDPRWVNSHILDFKSTTIVLSTFTPYFKWIKEYSKKKNPVMWDTVNKSFTNYFFFGGTRNIRPNSRTHIWRGPELLKLGEINLPIYTNLSDRNLDFADLDGLTLSELTTSSSFKHISCSSLRHLSIQDTEQHFFKFKFCQFDKTKLTNSKIQDFHFFNCELGELHALDTTIYKLSFSNSRVLPFIENCHLIDLIKVSSSGKYIRSEETYRLLKNAYNSSGQRRYAADFFYKEQVAHRKNLFHATSDHKYQEDYPQNTAESWTRILKKINTKEGVSSLLKKLLYIFQFFKNPKYLVNYLKHKAQWLYSFFDWLLWGYGVKPHRIALSATVVILFFAIIYQHFGEQISSNIDLKSFVDYIYFSMITFTTLGYGDAYPKTTLVRLLCGTEAFMGAFMMGLVVAGFSNKKTD